MKDLIIKGKLRINKSGFGFVIPEDEERQDIFIAKKNLKSALDNDTVMVRIIKEAEGEYKAEGVITEVVERSDKVLIGKFEKVKGKSFGFVILDGKYNYDLFIAAEHINKAQEGDKVICEIIEYSNDDKNPRGRIKEVLGKVDDIGIEVLAIAKKFELPTDFSPETIKYAQSLPENLSESDYAGRKDFRDLFTVTIDGADAKDFDDAISIDKIDNKYVLYVHIADVANYVKDKTDINNDAYLRGNSVYLLDRVIPMLPFELSNNLCSLNPKLDRLTMTVKMTITNNGKVESYDFYESVINSNYRLIYDDVSDYSEGKNNIFNDELLLEKLDAFKELHEILSKRRDDKGDIDFNFKETKLVLDEKGVPIHVGIDQRRVANMIIESFMVITNEVVGGHFAQMNVPFVYRVHERPTTEKETEFRKMIAKFGFLIKGKELYPKDYQNILKEADGTKYEFIINNLMLRSLSKADYRREANIHFGLATENYSHFTAPIRRYSDLIIHRIMKDFLHGNIKPENRKYKRKLDQMCVHISETERTADEAEREVMDLKKCEYMEDKVGNVYKGVISSLTGFGFFVELDNTIEGLIHFRDLTDDFYQFDEDQYAIIGERSNNRYELGQEVTIEVANVNTELREIDFRLVEDNDNGQKDRVVASNKKARRDYTIEDIYEAGIVLKGTEVKSIRNSKVSVNEAYCTINKGEVFINGMHVNPYEFGNIHNTDPTRPRKLLLNRREINKIVGKINEKGYTLIPLSVNLRKGLIKLDIALGKGKKNYDKRQDIAKKDADRRIEQAIKRDIN